MYTTCTRQCQLAMLTPLSTSSCVVYKTWRTGWGSARRRCFGWSLST